MKSTAVKIGVIVLALIIIAYIGANFFLGSLVRAGVNRYGPELTQTPVRLEVAQISPLSGRGTLTGLYVGNPPGWSSPKAFSLGKIHVEVVPSSIFGDHIVVEQLRIEKPAFVYETKLVSSNIGDLVKRIESSSSGGQAGKARGKSGQPLKFEVHHLSLSGGTITLGVGSTAMTVPMPPIEMTDLGKAEGGITSDQLALAMMRAVSTSIVQATVHAAGKVGSTMGAAAGDAAKKATDGLKGLFGH